MINNDVISDFLQGQSNLCSEPNEQIQEAFDKITDRYETRTEKEILDDQIAVGETKKYPIICDRCAAVTTFRVLIQNPQDPNRIGEFLCHGCATKLRDGLDKALRS